MTTPSSRFGFLLLPLLAPVFLTALPARAQQAQPTPAIQAEVTDKGWSADGSLVLCVRIHAPAKRGLRLYTGSSDFGAKGGLKRFSMAGSTLVDAYTGKRISALPRLPEKPYFGAMALATDVTPGGWMEFGVAFPPPPPPPPVAGVPQPYKLTLYIPLDATPINLVIPPKS